MVKKDYFKISNKKFSSRLIVGTGKYRNLTNAQMQLRHQALK